MSQMSSITLEGDNVTPEKNENVWLDDDKVEKEIGLVGNCELFRDVSQIESFDKCGGAAE